MTKGKAALDRVCENFIKNTMDFYDIPGIAVGVHVGKKQIGRGGAAAGTADAPYFFTGAGGYKNYETKDPVAPDTVFHCTSVSKLFTAAGIMKLVEAGKLSLADRLCDIVPWMSIADKRWENITIGSMLTHTSGLTDVADYNWDKHETDDGALKRYALSDEVAGRRLLWDPVAADEIADKSGRFRYSSMAYDLLGLVIAEVSGLSFEDFMAREIFEPLGMGDTTFLTFDRANMFGSAGLAVPHSKGRDRAIRLEEVYPYTRQHAPSSTLTSTAADLLKWAEALMISAPLHEETIQDMWGSRVEVPDTGEQMGLGWFVRKQVLTATDGDTREYALVGHEGSDDGFRTSFWMCPELGVATVLLCNLTDAPLKKLSKKLFETILK